MAETREQWLASIKAANDELDAKADKRASQQKPKRSIPKRKRRKQKKHWKFVVPDYACYMKSPAWKRKRQEALKHHGQSCKDCGRSYNLQVHHKTYVRLGRERMKDLEILCKDCHGERHPKFAGNDELSLRFRSMVATF